MLEWEPRPRGEWSLGPRLSSPGEWERKAVIAWRVGGSVCCSLSSVSNSLSHTTLSIKWEVYFSKELCPLVFIVLNMHLHMSIQQIGSFGIWTQVVVSLFQDDKHYTINAFYKTLEVYSAVFHLIDLQVIYYSAHLTLYWMSDVCSYLSIYLSIYPHTHTHTCTYIHTHTHTHTHTYIYIYIYMYE